MSLDFDSILDIVGFLSAIFFVACVRDYTTQNHKDNLLVAIVFTVETYEPLLFTAGKRFRPM